MDPELRKMAVAASSVYRTIGDFVTVFWIYARKVNFCLCRLWREFELTPSYRFLQLPFTSKVGCDLFTAVKDV